VAYDSLTHTFPPLDVNRLLQDHVPPPQFAHARLENYRPNQRHPSQQEALNRVESFAEQITPQRRLWTLPRRRRRAPDSLYLDGGYGVGKTHLLAGLAHRLGPEAATYGTFVEYTHLVGALGYNHTLEHLQAKAVVCIDEFELDDPGDTLMMSRMIRELTDAGVRVVATSNTQPEALGQERFAAEDFQREIQSLAHRFEILALDGPDYRARHLNLDLPTKDNDVVARLVHGSTHATLDSLEDLVNHLAQVHPSRYGLLLDGVDLVGVTNGYEVDDDALGLRLVVLVDRLYDRSIPVLIANIGLGELFSPRLLRGGYRKKYSRALSRLAALTELAHHRLESVSSKGEAMLGGTQAP